MQKTFDQPLPTLFEAMRANPRAMLDYYLWNAHLLPDGLQVLMFGATGGAGQPDYVPVSTNAVYASMLGLLLLILNVAGLAVLWLRRRRLWNRLIGNRVFSWIALATSIPTALVVSLVERPRPEYLYAFSVALMALTGLSLVVLWPARGRQLASRFGHVAILLVLLLVPLHFVPDYRGPEGAQGRFLLRSYKRLAPVGPVVARPGVLMTAGWGGELCNYVGLGLCSPADFYRFSAEPQDVTFAAWLERSNVTLAFIDEIALADTRVQDFLASSDVARWKTVASVDDGDHHWLLLAKREPDDISAAAPTISSPAEASRVSISRFPEDLRQMELNASGIYDDGWLASSSRFCLTQMTDQGNLTLRGGVPQIDDPAFTTDLTVDVDGAVALKQPLSPGDFEISVPSTGQGRHCFSLTFSATQVLPNGDGRQVGALLKLAQLN